MSEYTCIDCGHLVRAFGYHPSMTPVLCATCDWIRAHVPACDQPAVRERLGVPITSEKAQEGP